GGDAIDEGEGLAADGILVAMDACAHPTIERLKAELDLLAIYFFIDLVVEIGDGNRQLYELAFVCIDGLFDEFQVIAADLEGAGIDEGGCWRGGGQGVGSRGGNRGTGG